MEILLIVLAVIALVVVLLVLLSAGDIRRYMRMRRM